MFNIYETNKPKKFSNVGKNISELSSRVINTRITSLWTQMIILKVPKCYFLF